MAAAFVPIDRNTSQLFPPSIQDYPPEKHLARFVVETVDQLDLKHLVSAYSDTGSAAYHPALPVALLFSVCQGRVYQPQARAGDLRAVALTKANASKHKALSWEHANRLEE